MQIDWSWFTDTVNTERLYSEVWEQWTMNDNNNIKIQNVKRRILGLVFMEKISSIW